LILALTSLDSGKTEARGGDEQTRSCDSTFIDAMQSKTQPFRVQPRLGTHGYAVRCKFFYLLS